MTSPGKHAEHDSIVTTKSLVPFPYNVQKRGRGSPAPFPLFFHTRTDLRLFWWLRIDGLKVLFVHTFYYEFLVRFTSYNFQRKRGRLIAEQIFQNCLKYRRVIVRRYIYRPDLGGCFKLILHHPKGAQYAFILRCTCVKRYSDTLRQCVIDTVDTILARLPLTEPSRDNFDTRNWSFPRSIAQLLNVSLGERLFVDFLESEDSLDCIILEHSFFRVFPFGTLCRTMPPRLCINMRLHLFARLSHTATVHFVVYKVYVSIVHEVFVRIE